MLLHEFLTDSAQSFPNKTMLVCDNKRFSYEHIAEASTRLAHSFKTLGLQRSDRVSIFLDNTAESIITIFATLKSDATFNALSSTLKSQKLKYILNDSGTKILVTDMSRLELVYSVLDDLPNLEHILVTHSSEFPLGTRTIKWEDAVRNGSLDHLSSKNIDRDLAAIIYTSGSTGNPKGVALTHLNMITAAKSITKYLENKESDIILSALPLSFDYGLYQAIMICLFSGTLVLENTFSYVYQFLHRIEEEKVTGLPLVPSMAAMLLRINPNKSSIFKSLRYITSTAAVFPREHILKIKTLMPHVDIFSMYGLTECKRVSYLPPKDLDRKPDSVGRAIPNTEVYIVDEHGNKLPPNNVGELVVRGSNVMIGYWNDPVATERVLKPGPLPGEKVLYTGDLFRMDEEGYLYFVARNGEMIKTLGQRVSPREIEDFIHSLNGIMEVAVIGVPDDFLGMAIKAFIRTDPEQQITKLEIIKSCSANLESHMVPKYISFVDAFPRTSTGKIDKKNLSALVENPEKHGKLEYIDNCITTQY